MKRQDRMILLVALALIAGVIWMAAAGGRADTAEAWVICQPGDYINIRERASKRSAAVGRLECGDGIRITGKTENGFAEIADLPLETGEGAWIYAPYIVFDEPEWYGDSMTVIGTARVAARRGCGGEIRKWLQPGTDVQVFWKTEEWCVTNYGFIMTKFLEVGSV